MHENRNYQRELADSLIKSVGLDAAVDLARTNHWEGVLQQIHGIAGRVIHEGDDTIH